MKRLNRWFAVMMLLCSMSILVALTLECTSQFYNPVKKWNITNGQKFNQGEGVGITQKDAQYKSDSVKSDSIIFDNRRNSNSLTANSKDAYPRALAMEYENKDDQEKNAGYIDNKNEEVAQLAVSLRGGDDSQVPEIEAVGSGFVTNPTIGGEPVASGKEDASGFQYTIDDGQVIITGYNGDKTDIVIPSTIEGLPVTGIAEDAFFAGNLVSVVIPESVVSIGDYAFFQCENLVSIVISKGVISIGKKAFFQCWSLSSVVIPEGVISISEYTFWDCLNLVTVVIPKSVTSIGEGAFGGCSLISVVIPEGVTSIGDEAFRSCGNLESVVLPESVTSIGEFSFWQCRNLVSVVIPDGMTTIAKGAFKMCDRLTSVVIPRSVTTIGDYAFDCCNLNFMEFEGCPPSFGASSYPTPITFSVSRNMGWEEWEVPDGVTVKIKESSVSDFKYTISNGQVKITRYVGEDTDVVIPTAIEGLPVTVIGELAFCNNISLSSVTLPSSLISIGWHAFEGCTSLTSITIPEGVTLIDDGAFLDCICLVSVAIPSTVTRFLEWAFDGCSSLVAINVHVNNEHYASVDGVLFTKDMKKLIIYPPSKAEISYSIPDGVTTVRDCAFFSCTSLLTVIIPSSMTCIEVGAFYGCSSLASIDIPSSVISIEEGAFYGCSSLISVEIPSSVKSIGEDAFSGCSSLTSVNIPSSVTSIGSYAFSGCSSLSSVTIPASVTDIGMCSFQLCLALTEIIFMGTMPQYGLADMNLATEVTFSVPRNMGWEEWEPPAGVTVVFRGNSSPFQTLELAAGWNWMSFNVLPEKRKVGDVLGTEGFTANDIIQTNNGMARFNGTSWVPSNFIIVYGKMYQIHVTNPVTVEITGDVCASASVSVNAGWNWLANPTDSAVPPSELIHSGSWTAGDRIQSSTGIVTYTGSRWVPSNGFSLEPGEGYQIYTAKEGTISFGSSEEALYAVVDLSGGPNATSYPVRYTNIAPNLNDDTCRTTELWLRRIPKGTFIMGSPKDELGHYWYEDEDGDWEEEPETQHEVTLTQDFYIGVFECTQKQWLLVMGNNPSSFNGDCRPVERVSYDEIRGTSATAGGGWPAFGHVVDASSFMGKLQAKTGLIFDLPTEAQWEYACRAGTVTALNSGKNLTNGGEEEDAAMNEVGRYYFNGGEYEHTAKVGSYMPNVWGLYDMHGNVCEWCLDWWNGDDYGTEAISDPVGQASGTDRVFRGGSWDGWGGDCRSARRYADYPSWNDEDCYGFRIVCLP